MFLILQNDIDEKTSQLPPSSEDAIDPNDVYSWTRKVCRVCMLGTGVHAFDAWGNVPSRSTCQRIIEQQAAELEILKHRLPSCKE